MHALSKDETEIFINKKRGPIELVRRSPQGEKRCDNSEAGGASGNLLSQHENGNI